MMRRTKLLLIAVFIVVLLVVLLLFLRNRGGRPLTTAPSTAPSFPGAPEATTTGVPPFPPMLTSPAGATSVQDLAAASREALARSFTERFGSYSNQSNFENLEDLYPFMTERMREETQNFVEVQRSARPAPVPYTGTTTRALSVRTLEEGSNRVKVSVNTQRQEATAANTSAKLYYQEIELTLVKIGESWKVEAAVWK